MPSGRHTHVALYPNAQNTDASHAPPAISFRCHRNAGSSVVFSVARAWANATCVCLPLGNYHNMADLSAVQAGTNTSRARVGREHVAIRDYLGMVELLSACATSLGESPSFRARLDKLWDDRKFVLG